MIGLSVLIVAVLSVACGGLLYGLVKLLSLCIIKAFYEKEETK